MSLIFILGVVGLLLGLELTALTILREQRWFKRVIIPWLDNISNAVNPEKK